MVEEKMMSFVKTELGNLQKVLSSEIDFCDGDHNPAEGEPASSSRHALLKITLDFLRIMKQEQLAECLLSSKNLENQQQRFLSMQRNKHSQFNTLTFPLKKQDLQPLAIDLSPS